MTNFDSFVVVGQIIKSFGVQGQVKILSFCQNPLSIFDYNPILIESTNAPIFLSLHKVIKDELLIVCIPHVENKNSADRLSRKRLYADRQKFPYLSNQEFYFSDLEGCIVYTFAEKIFGKVKGIHNFGAGELLEILKFEDGKSLLIHFNEETFPKVNVESKKIVIIPPTE